MIFCPQQNPYHTVIENTGIEAGRVLQIIDNISYIGKTEEI